MYNKTVTVTTAELASGVVEIDTTMTKVTSSNKEGISSGTLYPREIQVINNCGVDLEWNMLANETEYNEYVDDSTNFGFILLPSTDILQDEKRVNKCFKFLVRPISGQVATADLRLDFISYGP